MLADNRIGLIRIKIERAYEHIKDLEDAIRDLDDPLAKTVSFNHDPNVGSVGLQVVDLHIYGSAVPAIAGDVVHNLRSALDHLAFHLVEVGVARGVTVNDKIKWEDIQFPIGNGIDGYKSIKPRKVEGMTREAIEAIDALEPYKGGNDALWLLRQLDNADKHKSIIAIGTNFIVGGLALQTDEPFFTALDVSNDEQDVHFSADETLIQMKIRNSNALLPTLRQIADFVSHILRAFAPLLNDGTLQIRVSESETISEERTFER